MIVVVAVGKNYILTTTIPASSYMHISRYVIFSYHLVFVDLGLGARVGEIFIDKMGVFCNLNCVCL